MVDIETVAIVGIGAVAGYLAIRSLKGAAITMPSIGITMPTIEMPAITMPTINLEGLKEGLVGFGEQIGAGFRGLGEQVGAGVRGLGEQIGAGFTGMGQQLSAGFLGIGQQLGQQLSAGLGAIGDAAKGAVGAVSGTLSGIGSTVKAGVQKGAEIASWVGPTLVGFKVAGPIGAVVGTVGRAGWELGSRLASAIREWRTPATALYEFVNRFGTTVQMRTTSIVEIFKAMGEKMPAIGQVPAWLTAMAEKYKVKVIEAPTKWGG